MNIICISLKSLRIAFIGRLKQVNNSWHMRVTVTLQFIFTWACLILSQYFQSLCQDHHTSQQDVWQQILSYLSHLKQWSSVTLKLFCFSYVSTLINETQHNGPYATKFWNGQKKSICCWIAKNSLHLAIDMYSKFERKRLTSAWVMNVWSVNFTIHFQHSKIHNSW